MAAKVFYLSDIVESAAKWSRSHEAMSSDLRQHDTFAGRMIRAYRGTVFKHTGDGFLAVFELLEDAIECARQFHRDLAEVEWQSAGGIEVRTAIVQGDAEERDGDFFGPTLNLAARLCANLGPGQAAVIPVQDVSNHSLLVNLGRLSFRGIGGSFRVYEVSLSDMSKTERRLKSALQLESIPKPAGEILGRARELEEVIRAFQKHSIVTLVGPGGIGKTRLALEAAAQSKFPDGVAWVSLGRAHSDSSLITSVWSHLTASKEMANDPMRGVSDLLKHAEILIVLDAVDHLLDDAASFVQQIVRQSDTCRFLLTSRSPLTCPGEKVIVLGSLPVRSSGLDLFRARVKLARGTDLTPAEAPTALEIVQRLEGIPLAIEIIASRVASRTISDLGSLLNDRARLLQSSQRAGQEHHRTLEAAFDWTYQHLSAETQAVFCALGLFRGSFTRSDVAELLAASVPMSAVDEATDALCECSMVKLGASGYHLLDPLRAYAELKASELGLSDKLETAYLGWAVKRVREIREDLKGKNAASSTARLTTLKADLWYAATRLLDLEQRQAASEIISALWRMWYRQGQIRTGLESLEPLWNRLFTSTEQGFSREELDAQRAFGWALYLSNHIERAFQVASGVRDCASRQQLPHDEAQALNLIGGDSSSARGSSIRVECYRLACDLIDPCSPEIDRLRLRLNAASVLMQLGDYSDALTDLQELELRFNVLGDQFAEAWTAANIGVVLVALNRLSEARDALQRSLLLRQKLGDSRGICFALLGLGQCELVNGDVPLASKLLLQAAEIAVTTEDAYAVGNSLVNLVGLFIEQKDYRFAFIAQHRLAGNPAGERFAWTLRNVDRLRLSQEICEVMIDREERLRLAAENSEADLPGILERLLRKLTMTSV